MMRRPSLRQRLLVGLLADSLAKAAHASLAGTPPAAITLRCPPNASTHCERIAGLILPSRQVAAAARNSSGVRSPSAWCGRTVL